MNKITLFFFLAFFISSCDKETIVWNLKRKNPKDPQLVPLELIYSNDCSDSTSLQLNSWGQKYNQMTGKKDTANCYWIHSYQTENPRNYFELLLDEKLSYDNNAWIDSASIEFDVNSEADFFIRFKIKKQTINNNRESIGINSNGDYKDGTNPVNKIYINNTLLNIALISEKYVKSAQANSSPTQEYIELANYDKAWHQVQTELISHNTKHIKISFSNAICVSEIELWKPKY